MPSVFLENISTKKKKEFCVVVKNRFCRHRQTKDLAFSNTHLLISLQIQTQWSVKDCYHVMNAVCNML